MSVKYRLVSIMGIALFCAVAFIGLSAEAFASPVHPATSHVAARNCPSNLSPGNKGSTVKQLQIALKNHGFKDARGHALVINGNYDGNTLYAVKHFEAQHHLPQNGKIDAKEWQLLGVCH
ncbi:MAG TPA: peptidoglycan-binding protein [Ktedonobacteraceae bacterium]|nr:peptidoglycan-binding protein [Ktedonobacteraceae bacterium]